MVLAKRLFSKLKSPSFSLRLMMAVIALLLCLKAVDLVFVELNRRDLVLPQFDVSLIPYHDPRVTIRNELLRRYRQTPQVIFTGDSRVKNGIDPETLAGELNLPWSMFFNFGTGSQVARFASEVFIPHLQAINRTPEFLVVGMSPDWPLVKPNQWKLIDRYRDSMAYRLQHERPNAEPLEIRVGDILGRYFALFRHRRDLIEEEIVPDLQCWVFGSGCYPVSSTLENARPLYFRDLKRLNGPQTPSGWEPQVWDGRTSGRFISPPRFSVEANPVDEEAVVRLIDSARDLGIEPVFVFLPVHDSFRIVHEPAMSINESRLRSIFDRKDVAVLRHIKSYDEATLFVDGHHLSHRGARMFSRELANLLHPLLNTPSENGE